MKLVSVLIILPLLFALETSVTAANEEQQIPEQYSNSLEASVALGKPDDAGSDQAASKPVLVFIKFRPSKTRSKADVISTTQKWVPAEWGAAGAAELSVIDNDAAVLTSANMDDALRAKEWLLTQQVVYEVELNQGGRVYRRKGDIPIEELRRGLSRNAQQERRDKGWQWLRRTAQQQGVKIKRPRRRRGLGQGGRGRGGQGQLGGGRDEL